MAGMLPGVESARRRRLRGSSGWSDSSSGFGSARSRLFHDTHLTNASFLRSTVNISDEDDELGGAAREAKERLDGRLRGHLKSQLKRQNSQERSTSVGRRPTTATMIKNLQMEVFGSKRFGWGRMGLSPKPSDQDECIVCLNQFKASEKLTCLPCNHRFHSNCVLPWLERNANCPCCRTTIFKSS